MSSEGSLLGLALQTAKGTPNTTDGDFHYFLYSQSSVAPANVTVPLETEVGGGAMLRDVKKMGVMSGGALEFTPRPSILGYLLKGALGSVVTDRVYVGPLDGSTVLYSGGLIKAPIQAATLSVQASGAATGNVVITGTGGAGTDTIALNGTTKVNGTVAFSAITNITLPTVAGITVTITANPATAHRHVFAMPANQFDAPYFTLRSAPGNMWGEQMQDMRASALGLSFKGVDFVRGTTAFSGGLPKKVATTSWAASTKVDGGPQFIAPVSSIELPTGSAAKVSAGAFTAGMVIPMDEQWMVGSYTPDDFEILSRAFALSFTLKISDATLYTKMMYDAAGGADWTADMFREANIKLDLVSDVDVATGIPYSISIKPNMQTGANANVIWSASPIGIRAGRQVMMNVTGIFVASPLATIDPIQVELVNGTASY